MSDNRGTGNNFITARNAVGVHTGRVLNNKTVTPISVGHHHAPVDAAAAASGKDAGVKPWSARAK